MRIKALVKFSIIDYPDKIASLLFTGGCNMRCPFCQNPELVATPQALPDILPEQVLRFLEQRRGLVDGVVISGGEPTLQPDLPEWLRQIKALGFAVKLDTNGYLPDVLAALLTDRLVDYVAMDIKSTLAKYSLAAGVPVRTDLITESIALLLRGDVDYEFRTTVLPDLLTPDDIPALAELLHSARRYYLQQFRADATLDPTWQAKVPYPIATLQEMARALCALGIPTEVRGG